MVKTLIVPRIDKEFQAACPLQTDDEKRLLREALKAEGCRDPIDVWDAENLILDGHTRFAMCNELGIPHPVRCVSLPDRAACLRWIRIHQLGRRNLTDAQRSILRGQLYNETKGEHGGNHGNQHTLAKAQNEPLPTTAEQLGAADGVSRSTVKRDAAFAENVEEVIEKAPELREAIEHGVIPKSAVEALSDAPKSELKKLAKKEGSELRKAANALKDKQKKDETKSGEQKRDPRLWKRIEESLGSALRMTGDLNRSYPHGVLSRTLTSQIKQCMATLAGWKDAVK